MRTKLAVNTGNYLTNGSKISDYLVVFDVYANDGRYLSDIKLYANLTRLIYSGADEDFVHLSPSDFKQICIANGVNILLGENRIPDKNILKLIEFNPNQDVLVFYLGLVLGKRSKDLFIKDGIFFNKYS